MTNYFKRYEALVDDWTAFQSAITRPLPICLWTNTLRTTPNNLIKLMAVDGITLKALSWSEVGFRLQEHLSPGKLWPYLAGLYHVQEEVSMLPVKLLDPQPGERILDLCAAPGGKTAQIAVALNNEGTVIANDRVYQRMRAVGQTIDRLGLLNVSTTTFDGCSYPKAAGLFDRVLVDVPCSCEGTSRKNPEVLRQDRAEEPQRLIRIQKALLRRAVRLCRPGGRIVYSTCTYAPEENEMVVDSILGEHGSDKLTIKPALIDGIKASPGVTRWEDNIFDPSLKLTMRVWPHQNDTGGFFIAVLEKTESLDHVKEADEMRLPALKTRLGESENPEPWLDLLKDRFGLSTTTFDHHPLFRHGADGIYLTSETHWPPAHPRPDSVGLLLLHTRLKYPKLSTAAAMCFGSKATQNYVDLSASQIEAYLTRQPISITKQQAQFCTGFGYVLVRYQNFVFGLGMYHPPNLETEGVINSMYPKAWAPVMVSNKRI